MGADLTIRIDELREISPGQLKTLSDEALFLQMQGGNHDALVILFDRYHHIVMGTARRILRDTGEAEDLMQAVFLEVFQTAAQFNPAKGTGKSWIMRIAYHRSLNRKQYLKTRSFYDHEEIESATGPELLAHAAVTAGLKEPEARALVHQALEMLNDAQRETLTLAFYKGLSMGEIAKCRKETVVNVRHHYYRGLQRLRCFLFGEGLAMR